MGFGTGIVLDTTFDNSGLPVATPYGERIRALADFHSWFQFDRNSVTLASGAVSALADLGGTAAALSQATASKRAALASDAVGGYSAGTFTSAANTNYALAGGAAFDFDLPHSIALVMAPNAFSGSPQVAAGQIVSGSTDRQVLFTNSASNDIVWTRNASLMLLPFAPTEHQLFIVSWDGATLRGEVNGTAATPVAVAGTTTANFFLGSNGASQGFNGEIADALLFTGDILSDADAAQLVRDYARYVYGIG